MSGWTVPGYTETGVLGAGATGRVVAAVHDATGTEMYNKGLSERRAEAVANYLAQLGVARGNLVPTIGIASGRIQ